MEPVPEDVAVKLSDSRSHILWSQGSGSITFVVKRKWPCLACSYFSLLMYGAMAPFTYSSRSGSSESWECSDSTWTEDRHSVLTAARRQVQEQVFQVILSPVGFLRVSPILWELRRLKESVKVANLLLPLVPQYLQIRFCLFVPKRVATCYKHEEAPWLIEKATGCKICCAYNTSF